MKGLMVEVCKATGRDVKKLYYDEEQWRLYLLKLTFKFVLFNLFHLNANCYICSDLLKFAFPTIPPLYPVFLFIVKTRLSSFLCVGFLTITKVL
jgi:hypothetical protein